MEAMTRHRSHSAAFKRQVAEEFVAEEFIAGETRHALSKPPRYFAPADPDLGWQPEPGGLTPLPGGHLIPPLTAAAGDHAALRYIDFFTANIRNPNTRRAYARACQTFFAWCDERGLYRLGLRERHA
jgi:hypothetical protein